MNNNLTLEAKPSSAQPVSTAPTAGPYEVSVLRTLEEVETVRAEWSAMQWNPEIDIDFVSFIIDIRPEFLHPHVIVVSQGGIPISILAGRIEEGYFEVKVGYKVLWRCKARKLGIFYGGLMGRTDPEIIGLVLKQLSRSLLEEKAVLYFWSGVRTGTDLQRLLRQIPGFLSRDRLMKPVQHWAMSLPASLDELLEKRMNKKHRYWAKRTMKTLEKDFPGGVRLGCFSTPEDMENLFGDVIKVAKKTYQWGLGVGFQDNKENRKRLRLEAQKGWLRGYVLYLKDEPIAFWISIVYNDTAYSAFTGYDPAYRKYEVGTGLFLRMIGQLCGGKVKQLDFGPGSAFYKERFGDINFEEATITVFASSFRGISLNLVRLITQGPVDFARKLLVRLGWEQKIKKLWRTYATPSRQAGEFAGSEVERAEKPANQIGS